MKSGMMAAEAVYDSLTKHSNTSGADGIDMCLITHFGTIFLELNFLSNNTN